MSFEVCDIKRAQNDTWNSEKNGSESLQLWDLCLETTDQKQS